VSIKILHALFHTRNEYSFPNWIRLIIAQHCIAVNKNMRHEVVIITFLY